MERYESLHHTKWECKYHLVWPAIPRIGIVNNRGRRRNGRETGVRAVFRGKGGTQGVERHFRGREIGCRGKTFPVSSRGGDS
jgi:hypothetical protein